MENGILWSVVIKHNANNIRGMEFVLKEMFCIASEEETAFAVEEGRRGDFYTTFGCELCWFGFYSRQKTCIVLETRTQSMSRFTAEQKEKLF